jgi:hypothetical protein
MAKNRIPDELPTNAEGFMDLSKVKSSEFMATKNYWESRGIQEGYLPTTQYQEIVGDDVHSYGDYMSMNGLVYREDDQENNEAIGKFKSFSPYLISETQKMICDMCDLYFETDTLLTDVQQESLLIGTEILQAIGIAVTNRSIDEQSLLDNRLATLAMKPIRTIEDVYSTEKLVVAGLSAWKMANQYSKSNAPPHLIRLLLSGAQRGETMSPPFDSDSTRMAYVTKLMWVSEQVKLGQIDTISAFYEPFKATFAKQRAYFGIEEDETLTKKGTGVIPLPPVRAYSAITAFDPKVKKPFQHNNAKGDGRYPSQKRDIRGDPKVSFQGGNASGAAAVEGVDGKKKYPMSLNERLEGQDGRMNNIQGDLTSVKEQVQSLMGAVKTLTAAVYKVLPSANPSETQKAFSAVSAEVQAANNTLRRIRSPTWEEPVVAFFADPGLSIIAPTSTTSPLRIGGGSGGKPADMLIMDDFGGLAGGQSLRYHLRPRKDKDSAMSIDKPLVSGGDPRAPPMEDLSGMPSLISASDDAGTRADMVLLTDAALPSAWLT